MWLIKRYARKSIYHVRMVWIEKSVTRDHCSASLGKPRDADQWPSWQIFLSTPYTHERYLYSSTAKSRANSISEVSNSVSDQVTVVLMCIYWHWTRPRPCTQTGMRVVNIHTSGCRYFHWKKELLLETKYGVITIVGAHWPVFLTPDLNTLVGSVDLQNRDAWNIIKS